MAAFVEEGEAERVEGEQAGALVGVLAKGDAECTRDEPDESEEEDEDVWVRRDGKVERAVREGVEHAEVGLAGEEKEDGGADDGGGDEEEPAGAVAPDIEACAGQGCDEEGEAKLGGDAEQKDLAGGEEEGGSGERG